MRPPLGPPPYRFTFALAIVLVLLLPGCHLEARDVQPSPPDAPKAAPDTRAAQHGERLFLGQARFQNGGSPCGSCHQLSTLRFPNGGTLGPDLSPAYRTLGEEGIAVTLQTLFFPTMMPLYEKRPLAPAEQQALKALLQRAAPTGPGGWDTVLLAGIAAAGLLLLLALTWLAWRRRLLGVRAPLVRPAAAGGVRP